MDIGETTAIDWVLPGLLVVTWLLLWVTRRRVRLWFLPVGAGLSVLCFPMAFVMEGADMRGSTCTPEDVGCVSLKAVDWMMNGYLGLKTCALLAILTIIVEGCVVVVRLLRTRLSGGPHPDVNGPKDAG